MPSDANTCLQMLHLPSDAIKPSAAAAAAMFLPVPYCYVCLLLFVPASVWILYLRASAPSTSATKRAKQRMPLPHISGSLPSLLNILIVRSVSPTGGRAKMTYSIKNSMQTHQEKCPIVAGCWCACSQTGTHWVIKEETSCCCKQRVPVAYASYLANTQRCSEIRHLAVAASCPYQH